MKLMVKAAGLMALVMALGLMVGTSTAAAADVHKWRMQTYAVPGTVGFQSQKMALEDLKKATDGRLDVTLFGIGALVGATEQLSACGKGLFEMVHNADAYSAGIDPGFAPIFSAIGLWEDPREVRVWIESFGGKEIMAKAYEKQGVKYVGSTLIGAEPIMSTKPLKSLADFKGIKIRTPGGLTSMLFSKLGAAPVSLPGSEIYSALDTGVIDAAEFVTLGENIGAGFHEVTKYVLKPSFHGPIAVVNWGVNKAKYDALPDDLKTALKLACYEADYLYDILSAAADVKALDVIREKGLVMTQLSAEDMAKVREMSVDVAKEYMGKSELSREVLQSILDFLKKEGKIQ